MNPEASLPPREAISHALRDDILDGRLQAGERLIEESIAERFGVSRVPVREALSQLQSEGFITLVRYRGATVSGASRADTLELMQVRRGLEVLSARLAAQHRGGAQAEALESIVSRAREARDADVMTEVPSLVVEFHQLVAAASGNRQLAETLGHTLRRVSWVFERHLDTRAETEWDDHRAIARAILNGSDVQAGYLMDEHIARDEQLLAELLRE